MRGWLLLACLATAAQAAVYVEAEDFPYRGDWQAVAGEKGAVGEALLCTREGATLPAVAAVPVPRAGRWKLWVRARDFAADRPGVRTFLADVDGQPSAKVFGAHGSAAESGWAWEDGGEFELPAEPVLVALRCRTSYARCDAVCLTGPGEAPPRTTAERAAARVRPAPVATGALPDSVPPYELGAPLGRLADERVALEFLRCRVDGRDSVALRVSARGPQGWVEVVPPAPEAYRVLQAPRETQLVNRGGATGQWPLWQPSRALPCRVALRQAAYDTAAGAENWIITAGTLTTLFAEPAVELTDGVATLHANGPVGQVTATWRLTGDGLPALSVRFRAAAPGAYGVGYSLGPAVERSAVEEVLCPWLHQYRRLPREPRLISTEITPTAMAALQVGGATRGLAFEPSATGPGWPDVRKLHNGFQLADGDGRLRAGAWDPVPGGPGSALDAGGEAELRVRLVAEPGPWLGAYRRVAEGLNGLRDYRHNDDVSLTDTALNVIDLLKDDRASGWSDDGLGFWNIEQQSTVTQAAPLVPLEAALLTGDEALLTRRALPILAYLLSRSTAHFAVEPGLTGPYGSAKLGTPTGLYGATVRLGAQAMARGFAPAFGALAVEHGQLAVTRGYGKTLPFEDAAAAWRATGEQRYRDAAVKGAEAYAQSYAAAQTVEVNPDAFYQLSYTGDWEGLLAAADALDDPALLPAARELALHMITGLLTHPAVAPEVAVHPGGVFEGNETLWWKGPKLEAVGWPAPTPEQIQTRRLPDAHVPEATVPGWIPSPVGLGIEQPTTYRRLRVPCAPIIMSNWAPALLRLGAATGEPLFTTAAHNAVLGRWANYPGYYVPGYTNLTHRADYPYRGPDVTGIYDHHIPPFLGLLLDYLVTDVEVRSKGAVRFPHERQMGYVWFDNRVFGHRPGTVYGVEGVWPWLRRGLVQLDTPRLNWLAGHTDDTVYVFLTNTGFDPVTATVKLDADATGGAAGPVTARCDNGPETPVELRDGAVKVALGPQGLAVLAWHGCRPRVPLHRLDAPAGGGPATAEAPGPLGTARAAWLGVDREHAVVHAYSDHDGSQARRAELAVTQAGQTRTLTRDHWPLEFLVPVTSAPVELKLDVLGPDGQRHAGPVLKLGPP